MRTMNNWQWEDRFSREEHDDIIAGQRFMRWKEQLAA
jgi:hypothetical protein